MSFSPELRGRLAVVTGASGGIGAASARRLADAGARVLIVSRDARRAQRVAAELGGVAVAADVAIEHGIDRVQQAVQATGATAPDVLVHAAGAFRLAPLVSTDIADFDRMISVNLRSAFLLIRAFVPAMIARGSGDVVTIGSVAGRQAWPSNGAYSASKFGVRGLCAVLATELRGTGVRSTLIEPTATDTPLWDDVDRAENPGLPERADMLDPAVIADAVLFAVTRPRGTVMPNILVERA